MTRLRIAQASRGTLVFIHGLGESGLCFEHILDHPLLDLWTRVAPELPGYGNAPRPQRALSLNELADALVQSVEKHLRAPVVLAGHSLGAVVALRVAERYPGLAHGLVDIDGNKSEGDCSFSRQAVAMDEQAFVDGGFNALCERVRATGAHDRALRGYYQSMRVCDPCSFYRHAAELVELSRNEQLAARLAALPIAKLCLAGSPGGLCARSLELLRQAGVPTIELPASGHWPFIDQPGAFAAALTQFLDDHFRTGD